MCSFDSTVMRLGFILLAIVLCGVCSAIPTDVSSASAASAVSTVADGTLKGGTPATGFISSSSADSGSFGKSSPASDYAGDDDENFEVDLQGGGFRLPLSSALLLSSHHGHRICLPDVLALSLLGGNGHSLKTLLPYSFTAPQKLHQELVFLKAFAKAGQQIWKAIASGHGKHAHLKNFAKVAGAASAEANAFSTKVGENVSGIAKTISSESAAAATEVKHAVTGN